MDGASENLGARAQRSESRKSNTANAVCLSAMCNLQRNDDGANNVRVDDASGRGPLRGAPSTGLIGSTAPRVHGSTGMGKALRRERLAKGLSHARNPSS